MREMVKLTEDLGLDNLNIPKFLKLPYKFFELYFDFLLIFFHALFLFMIKHQKLIILINLYQNLAAYKHLIFLLHGFVNLSNYS